MCLDEVRRGQEVQLVRIGDEEARLQLLRFGICEGCRVQCVERVPKGPCLIRLNRQEVAVGYALARCIEVMEVAS